jgi:hypothetical protein
LAEIFRLVTVAGGTATTVLDLSAGTYIPTRETFDIGAPPVRGGQIAYAQPYGGARMLAQAHDNPTIARSLDVQADSADLAIAAIETLLATIEQHVGLFVEWRPDGATNSVFRELRGPASWVPRYQTLTFSQRQAIAVTLTFPVAPLGSVWPAVVQLPSPVLGSAPALCDVQVATSGGAAAPVWALIGWTPRPSAPLAGSVAPFGVIEAETAGDLSGWAVAASASARGGQSLSHNTSGAVTLTGSWLIDPSTMTPDGFSDEIDVEVWVRVWVDSTVVSPRLTLSLRSEDGTSFGGERFTAEYGSAGKSLVKPSTGGGWRTARLGTISMPVDKVTPRRWKAWLTGTAAAGSSGFFSLDYLLMVPARGRALSPTHKANDSSYPKFIGSTAATKKTVRSDLTAVVASGSSNPVRDQGLGGSLLEIPTGAVDFLVKLSSRVPDDPTSDTTTDQLAHTADLRFDVTPRYFLARGS